MTDTCKRRVLRRLALWMAVWTFVMMLTPSFPAALVDAFEPNLQFAYSDDSISVEVGLDASASFEDEAGNVYAPEDVSLYANVLDEDDARFADLASEDNSEVRLFDLGFATADGVPVSAVNADACVQYYLPADIDVGELNELQVFQYIGEENSDGMLTEAEDVETSEADTAVVFTAGTLTSFAVVYTVDYEYDGMTVKMAGGSSLLLSSLFSQLDLPLSIADVQDVVFSDATLLRVERVAGEILAENGDWFDAGDGDWLLTSLGTFHGEEQLTVTLTDGTVFTIRVTDPEYSTDLSRFLTEDGMQLIVDGNVITGANAGETIEIVQGQLYDLILNFAEMPELQFSDDQPLTFQLPAAFSPNSDLTLSLDINLGRYGKLMNNPVTYDAATNTLTVQWNQEDAVHYQRLIASANAKLTLRIHGTVDGNAGYFLFDQDKIVNIHYRDPHNAAVEKFGEYDPTTQTITYQVRVTSDGTCEDLTLDDAMGTALIYNGDCAFDSVNSINTANTTPVITNTGGTFHVDIPAMNDGDILQFTYSCQIDAEEIAMSGNATFEETGNTAVIAGDSNPIDNYAEYAENGIFFSDMMKENTGVGGQYYIDGTPYRDIGWRIDTNHQPLISFAGSQITDTIDPLVQEMCSYSGSGITVRCYDLNGNLITTRVLTWEDLGYNPMTDDIKSWVYNVPADDPPYEYVVEYTTKVDMSQIVHQTVINNIATSKGGEDRAYCIVTPPGINGLSVSKTHTDFTSDHITWIVMVHIDSEYQGDHLTLTEHCNSNNNGLYKYAGLPGNTIDNTLFKEYLEKVEVLGLDSNETYVVKYNNRNYYADGSQVVDDEFVQNTSNNNSNGRNTLVIDFYKDQGRTQRGLDYASNGADGRNLIIKMTTSFDPEWPQAAKRYNVAHNNNSLWMYDHHNWADVNGALSVDIATQRPVLIDKRPVSTQNRDNYKSFNMVDPETGLIYEAFRFRILVQGVENDDPLVIDDYFDTDLFELFDPNTSHLVQSNGRVLTQVGWENGTTTSRSKDYYDILFGSTTGILDLDSTNNGGVYTAYRNVTDDSYVIESTDYGLRFTLNELPKKANGDYYPYYGVNYWLVPKNEEAISIIEQQIHDGVFQHESSGEAWSEDGFGFKIGRGEFKKYDNVAVCRGEEGSCQYDLYLDNELLPLLKSSVIDDENNVVHYTISINKGKVELNEGLPIIVEDTYSDTLSIDFRSIEIETDPADRLDQVSYDFSGRVGTFRVPDSTYVRITYDATILRNIGATTSISNTVTALGFTDGTNDTVVAGEEAYGEAENPGLYLYKFGAGHMEKGLNGAEFQLYIYDENGQNPEPMYYPPDSQNGKAGQPIIFETQDLDGRPGFIDVSLSQNIDGITLQTHRKYGLQEITTPTTTAPNGEIIEYKPITFKYTFTLVDNGENPDYSAYEYMIGDTMTVRNTPKAIGVKINKRLQGDMSNELTAADKANLKFTILRKDDNDEYVTIMREVEVNGQLQSEINPNFVDIPYDDFVNGRFTLSGLTPESSSEAGEYMVVETGNDAILSAHPSWEYVTSFQWDDGTVSTTRLTDADNPCGAGHPYSYFSIYTDDVDSGIDKEVFISNIYEKQTVELSVEKKWKSTTGTAIAWPGQTNVIFDLYTLDGEGALSSEPVASITLDGVADAFGEDLPGTATFKNIDKLDSTGQPLTYVVKERSGLIGYSVSYSDGTDYAPLTDGHAVITNTQNVVSVHVEKQWQTAPNDYSPPNNASVTLALYAFTENETEEAASRVNNVSPVTLDGSETPAWTVEFNDLPEVNTSGERLTYVVKEIACTPEGFSPVYVEGDAAQDGETIFNIPGLTDFSVSKKWVGTTDNEWPADVTAPLCFTLHRQLNGVLDDTFCFDFLLTETAVTYDSLPQNWKGENIGVTWNEAGQYTLSLTELDKFNDGETWEYFVTETMPELNAPDYTTSYYDKNFGLLDGYTTNGGQVRNTLSIYDLVIQKEVTGTMGDRHKDFDFALTLSGPQIPETGTVTLLAEKVSADGTENDYPLTFTDGTALFTLRHDEQLIIHRLSLIYSYSVTETDASDEYHTTYRINGGGEVEGKTASGTMDGNQTVLFHNENDVIIATGLEDSGLIFAAFALASAVTAATLLVLGRKRRLRGY